MAPLAGSNMTSRILIVEDDETLRGLLLEDLPQMGFETVACGTLREAHERISEQVFHALLLDCRLTIHWLRRLSKVVARSSDSAVVPNPPVATLSIWGFLPLKY